MFSFFSSSSDKNNVSVQKQGVVKHSFWSKILSYAANDPDYDIHTTPTATPLPPHKKGNLWRQIKSGLLILIIGYILLAAYVLLNPQNALFFNNILGIQYLTLKIILEYTIYIVYSIFGIVLGIGFLFFGYRAFAIKTKKRSKRINLWLLTIFFCCVFFINVALFAVTYDWFRRIDFDNLEGRVIVYNNALLKYIKTTDDTSVAMVNTPISIGPLQVRYDISAYIKKRAFLEGLVLTQPYTFEIDYNGDKKADRGSGTSNHIDAPITDKENAPLLIPDFTYDEVREYAPKATIEGIDVAGKKIKFDIDIPKISLNKIIKIERTPLPDGSIRYAFDATDLSELGKVKWTIIGSTPFVQEGYHFSPDQTFSTPTIICLQVFRGEAPVTSACDWRFVTEENTQSNIQNTEISFQIDPLNPLKYQFSVNPHTIQGEIRSVRWYIDNQEYVGKFESGFERIFDYTFRKSGTYKIEAAIEDSLGNIVRIGTNPIYTAETVDLKEGYTVSIQDENGIKLDQDTYDTSTASYLLPDFSVPGILKLDATKIRANSTRLRLTKVEWDTDNDGAYESEGYTLNHPIDIPGRYDIKGRYTFTDLSIDGHDIPIVHIDRIAVIGVQKPLDVRVKITPDSEYAPASVRFDTSGSKIQKGEIKKFLYNFGDGKTYEGEGVVATYNYQKPGEYTITVTAVSNTGLKSSKNYTLILKKPQENVRIQPSIASGLAEAHLPITFEAMIQGSESSIYWDFGDGTGIVSGKKPIHSFRDPGTYTIKVRVQYSTGIEESDTITYIIR